VNWRLAGFGFGEHRISLAAAYSAATAKLADGVQLAIEIAGTKAGCVHMLPVLPAGLRS